MNNRLGALPSEHMITELTELKQTLDAFKERQRTSGQSGVLSYFVQSGNTWDLTATVGLSSDTSTRTTTFTIQYIGDSSQPIAFANLSFNVFVNGTDSAHQLTPVTPSWTDGTRTASITYEAGFESETVVTAHFQLVTLKDVTFFVKAYASASQRGTISGSYV